jgi:hypothetical protein
MLADAESTPGNLGPATVNAKKIHDLPSVFAKISLDPSFFMCYIT